MDGQEKRLRASERDPAKRRAEARTRDRLWDAMSMGLEQITAQDIQGWFHHCGYVPTGQYS